MRTDIKLPKDWKWIGFGDATKNFDGKRVPLSKEVRSKRKGKYRYYGATEIVDYIDDYLFDGKYLLIGEDGANLVSKSRDLAFIVNGQFWVNNHAHVLQTKDDLILEYLHYYFNSLNLAQFVTGTAQPKLNQGNLNKIPVPLPPLSTQQAIVSKIEELFSELDNGIANLKTAQQQLKTYRQSVLKWAFEGKLTNKKVKEGELPKGWQTLKIKDICEIKGGKNQSKVINPNGKYPIYGSSGIFGYADEYICDENTTIVGRKGNINSPLFVTTKFWNVDTAFGLCVNSKYDSKLLFYFCLGFNFKKLDKSTTIPSLAKSDILSIDIQVPPYKEQNVIVQEIESRLSVADKMEESITQSLQQAEALRQSILKKAFSGELVPSSPALLPTEKGELNVQPVLSPSVLSPSPRRRGTKGEVTIPKREGTTPSNT